MTKANKILTPEYKTWLTKIKSKIRSVQLKNAVTVNSSLIQFYFELGQMISQKQTKWGSKFLERLSLDLKQEFPRMQGFSITNLKYCKLFYEYLTVSPQLDDQFQKSILNIPWGHTKILIGKIKDKTQAQFYIQKTLENGWSRDTLALQLKSDLYQRNAKAISNFKTTLPDTHSDLALQTLKDPYIFDFLQISKKTREKDIEDQLINNLQKFLLELGKGFAFLGRQYQLTVAENDYFLDLLFYHTKLKCYVVIELKNTKFKPEYVGKLNFYLSAVDDQVKDEKDNPTIGILLCRDKNNLEVEFALRGTTKPMGISEFEITSQIPDKLKQDLPTVEELESQFFEENPTK